MPLCFLGFAFQCTHKEYMLANSSVRDQKCNNLQKTHTHKIKVSVTNIRGNFKCVADNVFSIFAYLYVKLPENYLSKGWAIPFLVFMMNSCRAANLNETIFNKAMPRFKSNLVALSIISQIIVMKTFPVNFKNWHSELQCRNGTESMLSQGKQDNSDS